MNDCETMILDELKEVKKDVKNLLLDVNTLKVKSTIWGIVGGALFSLATMVVPLVYKTISSNDTNKAYSTPIDTVYTLKTDTIKVNNNVIKFQ